MFLGVLAEQSLATTGIPSEAQCVGPKEDTKIS